MRSTDHEALIGVLIQARIDAGLSQRALAQRMGVTQNLIGRVETGERNISVPEFITWSESVGTEPEALFKRVLAARSNQ